MRYVIMALCVSALATPVWAQDVSAEADHAMWCSSAITVLDKMGAYPPEAPTAVAVARLWHRQAFMEFQTAGLKDEMISALIDSYVSEAYMQLSDYLISSDPDALRFDLNVCLER